MTSRERVLATLNHQSPDKVPYDIGFTQKAHEKMVEYYGDPDFVSKLDNCLDSLGAELPGACREVRPDVWEDEFGVQWDQSVDKDIGVVCNTMITPDNIDDYGFPDPDDPSRYEKYPDFIQQHKAEGFIRVNYGFSLFERAWTLAGMENILMWMITDKDFVNKLLDRILEFNLRIIDNVLKYDIDAMQFGDDWGQQQGLIMGPELWREFIKPRIRQMYGKLRNNGKYVFIHSCGKVEEIFPDLIESGLNVFNPFQPEVIDVFDAKKKYGNDLTFYGGISTQKTLPYGTPDETRDEVKRLIDEVGADGGYIASPAHATPADAKAENIAAMIEVLQNQ